jgi:flagellar biosynthesis anti-sigma factor FlgM
VLILSKTTESSLANAEFDADKVARIKTAIREGNYPVDAAKVAESFIALERMIDGS